MTEEQVQLSVPHSWNEAQVPRMGPSGWMTAMPGYTKGPFGVFHDFNQWNLTHTPSGVIVKRYDEAAQAFAAADRLTALQVDWPAIRAISDYTALPQSVRVEVERTVAARR